MKSRTKIIVVGSSNTDMVVKSEHLPKPGETVMGGTFMMNSGGKGANQAVAIAKLGGEVCFVCNVGDDVFGKKSIEDYNKYRLDTSHIRTISNEHSGVAIINIDCQGENSIAVASGVNMSLSCEDIDKAEASFKEAAIVLLQLEVPLATVIHAARIAKMNGATVVLNPAPAPREPLPDELLTNIDIIIPNKTEAEQLSGVEITDVSSVQKAIKQIADKGIGTVIVTLGSKGSYTCQDGYYLHIPANKVNTVDTTAAGDTFCGALCVALAEGKSLTEAITFGSKAASITVTRMGAQDSIPFREEIV